MSYPIHKAMLFGGPADGQIHPALGVRIEFAECYKGPPHCHAFHIMYHIYEYVMLENGRLLAVYAGPKFMDYPCEDRDGQEQTTDSG